MLRRGQALQRKRPADAGDVDYKTLPILLKRLRELRKAKRLTQEEFGESAAMSYKLPDARG